MQLRLLQFATPLLLLLLAANSWSAELTLVLKDQDGKAVSNAVAYISLINGQIPATVPLQVEVDQIDEAFVPHVRAITVGSTVNFPNSDHVRHHVYSFSASKTFELPLYTGIPAEPVSFDKAGVVTLGCNIHDHMLGYILVLDTPYYLEINNGTGTFTALPAGDLQVEIWHPLLAEGKATIRQVTMTSDASSNLEFTLMLKPEPMLRRAPRRNSSRY